MRFDFKPSFKSSLKRLSPLAESQAKETSGKLMDFYVNGKKTPGLGLCHLKGEFWEVRSGLRVRLLYCLRNSCLEFILAGNHEDVRRFLRRH